MEVQDCGGGWRFHTFIGEVDEAFDAYCGQETDATGWFTEEALRKLPLHPGIPRWFDEHDPESPTS